MASEIILLDGKALAMMGRDLISRQNVGPNTDTPCLCIDLTDCGDNSRQFIQDSPCPVIGVGHGALENACDVVLPDDKSLSRIVTNISKAPIAAMTLVQLLRASETLDTRDALIVESFAYSTVQKGPEFQQWLQSYESSKQSEHSAKPPVLIHIEKEQLTITLNRPHLRNAIDVKMRDALCEALDLALADSSIKRIRITGAGACFSIGGDIDEFGEASDPATAHWVRTLRLPAWRLARMQDRLEVHVNGAAIGAGAEIAAFANRVTAAPKAWFQLPELKYGLIPGAGGCVSITRRIGRQRTVYMALSMARVSAETALDWGLVDAIES